MVGSNKVSGGEHDNGRGLAKFTVVWSENRIEVAVTYGGSWRFYDRILVAIGDSLWMCG